MISCCRHYLHLHSLFVLLTSFALLAGRCTGDVECSSDQRSLLLHLKHGFSFSSNELVSWKPGSNCCTWEGVTCNSESGQIISLDLGDRSITGYISHSLFNLTSLQALNLTFNPYNDHPIPQSGFEKLKDLTHLSLTNANFVGQLPIGISHLTRLMYLNLDACDNLAYTCHLKLQTLVGNLSNLRELRLQCANMSSDLDWSSAMSKSVPQLQVLILSGCDLRGFLPEHILTFKNWTALDLSYNLMLSGDLPDFPVNNALQGLGLRYTNLSGSLPGSIGNLKYLTDLDLSYCGLTGGIPSSIGSLIQLVNLYLFENNLTGDIPNSIGNLTQLVMMYLSINNLVGMIPASIGYLSQLDYMDLSDNNLVGTIPASIGNLSQLTSMDLYMNNFTALNPTSIRNLTKLVYMDLEDNSLRGSIPVSLFGLPALNMLYLSYNQLSGPLEEFSDKSISLAEVDLSNNLLTGKIPRSLFELEALESLDLSSNSFNGPIPLSICKATLLEEVHLSNNNLSGSIPQCFPTSSLLLLDLSNNNLSGSIPQCLLEVVELNLSGNQLQGTIPLNITDGCNMTILVLSDNHLEGPLPRSLVNCSALMVLDIGNNHITDHFPFWLGNMVNLTVLALHSNELYGPIKSMNGHEANEIFPMLQIFDLSSNHLDGDLPTKYFYNLKSMMNSSTRGKNISTSSELYTYIVPSSLNNEQENSFDRILTISYTSVDFSNNHFEGDIPMVIGELQGLYKLNLSHNALTGRIPSVIGNMTQLESLDLSANHLSGEIPQELTSLTFLSSLNLSTNNLSGEIPPGGQFSTFSSTSFDGNPGLCGIPLVKQCINVAPWRPDSVPPSKSDSSWLHYVIGLALFIGLGFGVGIAVVIVLRNVPLKFCRRGNDVNA